MRARHLPADLRAALLILALTYERAPLARALSFPLFVYLGRVSYAVYLLQLTPFFVVLAALFLQYNALLPLYLLVNLVGIVFYEGIEKPWQRRIMARRVAHSGA